MSAHAGHVVMVTNSVAPDKLGGLERYVRELARGLVEQGTSVTVVSKRTHVDQPLVEKGADGVRVRRYTPPPKTDPLFGLRYTASVVVGVHSAMRRAIEDGDGLRTVVHGHFPVPMLGPALRRVPYVYTCHAPVYKELLAERRDSYLLPAPAQKAAVAALRSAEALVVRRARSLVTLSEFVQDEVGSLNKAAASRVIRIPGGLDTEWFTPGEEAVRSGDELVLFSARRLVERTGVDRLIQAMPQVLAFEMRAHLYLAGDGPLRQELQAAIRLWGLEDKVTLLGRVSDEALRDWYRRADIAITPTTALEGFGLSTVEALACGTPALVTPVGANPEVVKGLSRRLITDGPGPSDIARGILSLITSREIPDIRARARAFVHPRLGWPAVVQAHQALYRRMPSVS
ncbi:glycosyltransferase family 4 protein [Microbacterium testaceum]|uniref:glycosyltransferase family 4 protein n=1 Tax=Microbacterium testaceum TaxID=2033 RepID=UPI002AC494BC|nr:glycosyltransferase family 4 protein [Microbacterium testaceum]MDZ5146134.1 glycosyltransferase family 4 protein [Microbacterium testaceum]